jgi:transcriptional regulator with GAF, ATPase, and Fis domain
LERRNALSPGGSHGSARLRDLIGQSAALRQIISQIELVAPTDASVLVLGETGTARKWSRTKFIAAASAKDGPASYGFNCALDSQRPV